MFGWCDMRWLLAFGLFYFGGLIFSPVAVAESEGLEVASRLPVEVAEVVSGGTWIDGQASGSFRTVTIQTYAPSEMAEVYLQWIGSRSPVEPLQVISSVPLREFNEMKLASASITLDTETEGVAKIVVAGQDAGGRPAGLLSFRATGPGRYELVPSEVVKGK
jgi:hypothetical protein